MAAPTTNPPCEPPLIANLFGLRQIEIPDVYQSKDPSDLCKNFDRATLKTVVNQLISENLNNNF